MMAADQCCITAVREEERETGVIELLDGGRGWSVALTCVGGCVWLREGGLQGTHKEAQSHQSGRKRGGREREREGERGRGEGERGEREGERGREREREGRGSCE